MFRKLSTTVLLLLLGAPIVALAQGTGTLAGRVTDGATGDGLPTAQVIVTGTELGAATDLDGNYRIIGIPVGQYDVEARFVGFETETVTNVQISSGYTTQQDFALTEGIVMDEIFVEYERPLIQRDAIGAPRVVTGDDIQNLPVRGVSNVAALQGGVVSSDGSDDLNIRGGRQEEVQYYVDGVKVGANSLVGINQNAIQEQEMLIGTIPARYGDVQSGVISITTRSGSPSFFGAAEVITSEVLDAYGYNLASLSLGGPLVPGGRVSFFLSGEGTFQSDDSPFAIDTYRLSDEAYNNLQANPQVLQLQNGAGDVMYIPFPYEQVQAAIDGGDTSFDRNDLLQIVTGSIPEGFELADDRPINAPDTFTADDFELGRGKDDPQRDLTFNGNLNFNFTSALSLRLGGGYSQRNADNWSFYNSLYNRDRFYTRERESWRVYGTFRQRVSDNAFYQLQGEYQTNDNVLTPEGFSTNVEDALFYGDISHPYNALSQRYFAFSNGSYGRQYTSDGNGLVGQKASNFTFHLPGNPSPSAGGGSGVFYQRTQNDVLRFSGSATTQLNVHQVEFGGEFQRDTRRFYSLSGLGLSRYFNDAEFDADGNLIPGTGAEALADRTAGYDSYGELPFTAFDSRVTYYGYDFRGLNEVDDQNITDFLNVVDDVTGERANANIAPYEPIYYAGYLQDKIEFRDLVINLGLRVDVFDNNTIVLKDVYAARPVLRAGEVDGTPNGVGNDFAVYFNNEGDIVGYRDLDGNFFDPEGGPDTQTNVTETNAGSMQEIEGANILDAFEEYDPQVTVMPRVGVSFPVTDEALFFASYNVTSQRPTEQAFTTFRTFVELESAQGSRTPNPRLEPERTTQYELGFRQRVGERAALTLSGFYRTQENKISNRRLDGGLPAYGTYLNADFTTTKGAEIGFELRRTNNLAINANYTLAFAQGTGSDANATATIVWRGEFFPQFISPADFDQRHTANISLDYRFGDDEGPMVGGTRLLENFGVNVLTQYGSGQAYTPLVGTQFSVDDSFTAPAAGTINGTRLPASYRVDLKVDRSFDLGFAGSSLKAYFWVQNLFDTQNVLAVYRATGLADDDGYLAISAGESFLNNAIDPDGAAFNYSTFVRGPVNIGGSHSSAGGNFYSQPRRIRLGLLFNF